MCNVLRKIKAELLELSKIIKRAAHVGRHYCVRCLFSALHALNTVPVSHAASPLYMLMHM
jgi:hypothetical protein